MNKAIPASLALLVALIFFWILQKKPKDVAPIPPAYTGPEDLQPEPSPPQKPLPGDKALKDYGTEESSGKEDLEMLGRFVDSVFLLVKNRDTSEYATNEDLVLFLQGKNAYGEPYLGSKSSALNEEGQLIDRWGSPIIVHPISQKLLELRSAGPDQKPYSGDDFTWPRKARR
ncbi:MAG: hypothetical protein ACON38_18365 [Akkermansiaceae bacterium]